MSDSLYQALGGEQGVQRLVDRFYDIMSDLPETQGVLNMHPKNLASSRKKLTMFLSGWTGGPQLYVQRYGHPRLRMRHLPFAIGESERDQWMLCMRQALAEEVPNKELRDSLERSFYRVADHMRNKEG